MKKIRLIFLGLIIPFLINSQNCGDLRVHMIPQNSFYQVVLTTNYDRLLNINPNVATHKYHLLGLNIGVALKL